MTATEGPTGTDQGTGQENNGDEGNKTFAPITSQEEFDSRLRDRLARERAKFSDYDDLKSRAAEADRLRQEQETASEKAVREAREQAAAEARADERSKSAPQLVRLAFRAAAKGTLSDEARDALVEDLDLTKYLTDKGEVDIDKVEKKVAAVAPKKDDKWPATGQGDRGRGTVNKGAGGAAEAARRFAKTNQQ